jgi:hypothetical protein
MRIDFPVRTTSEQMLENLLDRVRPVIAQTVDPLQVAALLEADGITDEGARNTFGFEDVFHLATEVRRRCVPAAHVSVQSREPGTSSGPRTAYRRALRVLVAERATRGAGVGSEATTFRLVSHGVLYLLPATVFPAVLAVLGPGPVIRGLVIGAAVAWVWAGAATWVAYQLLSAQRPDSAAYVLRIASLAGLLVAAATASALAGSFGYGPGLAPVAVAQMAYQMGATVLMFHRREELLVAAMVPAVIVGSLYMLSDAIVSTAVALVVGGSSVLAVLALSLVARRLTGDHTATAAWTAVQGDPGQFVLVVIYTGLTAAYLLQAQARYMFGSLEVAIGLLPLIVGMGVVELQAYRFRSRASALKKSVRYPQEFASGIRWILFHDVAACALTVAGLGVLLLGGLALRGALSPAGVAMTLASVFLASAYYLSFLMTGIAMLGPLCAAVALALTAHVIAVAVIPAAQEPFVDTSLFAATSLLLMLISLVALLPSITDPRTL